MDRRSRKLWLFSVLALGAALAVKGINMRAQDLAGDDMEKQAILNHVHAIFRAFIDRDRDRIRMLHTDDWVGFLGPSTQIERGIDAYMVNADKSLDGFRGTGYEINDSEVQIYGDIALVFYVATYYYETDDADVGTIPLRSIDVFRRENGEWHQSASHIAVIPSGGRWGEGDSG